MTRSVVQWDGTAAPMTDKSEFEDLIEGAAWAQRPPTPGVGRAGTSLPDLGTHVRQLPVILQVITTFALELLYSEPG